MLFNIFFGFIIPWATIGLFLYKKNKRIIFLIVPFACVTAHIVNSAAFAYGFWYLTPKNLGPFASLPSELGYFALSGGLFIYLSEKYGFRFIPQLLIAALISTCLEIPFLYTGRIMYGDGWNIFLTYFSYLFPYSAVYGFYSILKRNNYIYFTN